MAFSVPINSVRAGANKVIGVLAMSVDLNEFNVLEKRLPPGHEVVLIDLRESVIDGEPRRGLILHHQAPHDADANGRASFVGPELLERFDKVLSGDKSAAEGTSYFLTEYRDPAVTGR